MRELGGERAARSADVGREPERASASETIVVVVVAFAVAAVASPPLELLRRLSSTREDMASESVCSARVSGDTTTAKEEGEVEDFEGVSLSNSAVRDDRLLACSTPRGVSLVSKSSGSSKPRPP